MRIQTIKSLKSCVNLKISTLEDNILCNKIRSYENISRLNKERTPKKLSKVKIKAKCPRGRPTCRERCHTEGWKIVEETGGKRALRKQGQMEMPLC
jgi:hypothetical protein